MHCFPVKISTASARRAPSAIERIIRLWAIVTILGAGFSFIFQPGPLAAQDAWDDKVLKVGVLEEPRTLNLWLASDSWSSKVLELIYDRLYEREPQGLKLIPWLAKTMPVCDKTQCVYTLTLREAQWSDGTPFTAHDVVFTGNFIKKFKVPRYYSRWNFVKSIKAVDDHTVKFVLSRPKATFLTRTLTTPIAQKKQWEPIMAEAQKTKKPLQSLLRYKMENPVGTGPFALKTWHRGTFVYMTRNEHFFGRGVEIAGRKLGPYIHGIIFKTYGTSDAAILALRKGTIDFFWYGIQPGYLDSVKRDKGIKLFYNQKSALYFMGFNLRRTPFNDLNFRRAVATLIDDNFIIRRILQDSGSRMKSVVPPGNTIYHCADVTQYGEGLSRNNRIKAAYRILKDAGYNWAVPPVNAQGEVVPGKGMILPNGKPLKPFTILTPPADYDPHRAMSGMMIQEWLRIVGIPAVSRPMSFGAMIQKIKARHDFDCFVLGYARLSLDPGWLRSFFHSSQDRPRGWNMTGYKNPAYDALADTAENTLDQGKRQAVVFELQRIIARDLPFIPLYNPLLVEGARIDRFKDWVPMLEGVGNVWSFCEIKPATPAD